MESALQATELEVLPEFAFGEGVGADTLLGRLAILAKTCGDDRLHAALSGKDRPAPADLAALCAEVLAGEGLAGKAMVFTGLERLLSNRDGSFWRDERLEMVLTALITSAPAVRLVFVSTTAPVFYREGQALSMRVLELGGIKGKELHELFESYQVPEFSRDRFGPIQERVHGHPMASRCVAIRVREEDDVDAILERPRYMKAESVADLQPLLRDVKARLEGLDDEHRAAVARAAHLLYPGNAADLQVLGIPRKVRLRLLADGLMEQTPVEGHDRRYYVRARPSISDAEYDATMTRLRDLEGVGRQRGQRLRQCADQERGQRRDGRDRGSCWSCSCIVFKSSGDITRRGVCGGMGAIG